MRVQEQERLQNLLSKKESDLPLLHQESLKVRKGLRGAALLCGQPTQPGSALESPPPAASASESGTGSHALPAQSPHGATDMLLAAARAALQRERVMRQQARAPLHLPDLASSSSCSDTSFATR